MHFGGEISKSAQWVHLHGNVFVHAVLQETSGLAQLFELKIKYASDFMDKKVILLNMKESIFHECLLQMWKWDAVSRA